MEHVVLLVVQQGVDIQEEAAVLAMLTPSTIDEVGHPLAERAMGGPFGHDRVECLNVIIVSRTTANQDTPRSLARPRRCGADQRVGTATTNQQAAIDAGKQPVVAVTA